MPDIKLNRRRSYGTVSGHPEIRYVQDGLNFGHDGSLILPPGEAPPPVTVGPTEEESIADRNRRRSESMKARWAARKGAQK